MALVVEDGTSVPGAESYATVAEADAYWLRYGNPAAWSGASAPDRETAMRLATQWLENKYRSKWRGVRSEELQGLSWPRVFAQDHDGYVIEEGTIPNQLKQAVYEMALRFVTHGNAELEVDVAAAETGVRSKKQRLDVLEETIEYTGAAPTQTQYPKVSMLVRDLIEIGKRTVRIG